MLNHMHEPLANDAFKGHAMCYVTVTNQTRTQYTTKNTHIYLAVD